MLSENEISFNFVQITMSDNFKRLFKQSETEVNSSEC